MNKFYATIVAIAIVLVVGIIALTINAALVRDSDARTLCINKGGIWSNSVCTYSR
jgi:hypothetical protein